jgi:hypothetical protein
VTNYPNYPAFEPHVLSIVLPLLLARPRSFRQDAVRLTQRIRPAPLIEGTPPHVSDRGIVVAVNHYTRSGFGAWWIALSIAAAMPVETHWMMTSAWVYPDQLRSWTVTPMSRWVLARIARSYGFTSAPPMPPRLAEFGARATAVRSLLRYIDQVPEPVIAIAPEGSDSQDGTLQIPPAGVSHLFQHLYKRGMSLVPVGVFENRGRLITKFGEALDLTHESNSANIPGNEVLTQVMRGIAACLPAALRGRYA